MMELTVNEAMDLVQESNLFESPKRAVLRLLEELQSRRAAEREQAAPKEPKLPRWARRMKEMGCLAWLTFDDVSDPPQWKVIWQEKRKGKIFCAATAKAAVKAAWRAWKEARRDA